MTQRALWVVCLVAALAAGCGTKGSGTFVVLDFSATGAAPKVVHAIDVDIAFDGHNGHAHFEGKNGGDITLPIDGTVELGTLGGTLSLNASSKDGAGNTLSMAQAQAHIEALSTTHLSVIFGGTQPDAGGTGGSTGDAGLDGGTGGASATGGAGGTVGPATGGLGMGGVAGKGQAGTGMAGAGTGGVATGGVGGMIAGGGGKAGGAGGQGTTALGVDRTTADFGSVMLATSSQPTTLIFTNTGTLPVGPLMVVSSDATRFPLTGETCAQQTLAPGATCMVSVRFSPTVAGTVSSTLSVGTGSSFHTDVTLSGSGFAPNSPAKIVVTASHDYGIVDVGKGSSFDLVVANSGGSASSNLTVSGTGGAWSLGADNCTGKSLAGGAQCTVSVTFMPSAAGMSMGSITASATTGGSSTSSVSGTGRVTTTLVVNLAGGGAVAGTGLSCTGATCTGVYTTTDPLRFPVVQLNATPDSYSLFGGWTGASACSTAPNCSVTVASDMRLTAAFNPRSVTINLNVMSLAGHSGIVSSGDGKISCKDNCPALTHAAGPNFVLEASPNTGSSFAAWNSAYLMVNGAPCRGTSSKCVFDLSGDVNITAVFGPQAYMFVTSTSVVPGLLGGVAGADAECAGRARAAGLPGSYSAWMSGKSFNANQRVGKGGWIRTDGRVFASSLASLTASANLQSFYPPRLDENGNDFGPNMIPVATGANQDGSSFGPQCAEYTSTSGDLYVGAAASGAGSWSYSYLDFGGCSQSRHLYCFRNDLSGEIKPPPVPGRRIFVSRTQLPSTGGVTLADTICRTEAKAAGFTNFSTYVALLSTSSMSAASRFTQNGPPFKRPDDVQLTLAPGDLGRGLLLAPINVTADGALQANRGVWSGSPDLGATSSSAQSCRDWSDGGKTGTGIYGYPNQGTTSGWWNSGSTTCDTTGFYVLCVEP